ncbi:MAG: PASTA domain-containing protein [bacterium]
MALLKEIAKQGKWTRWGIRAVIVMLGLLAFLLLLDNIIMPWYVKRGEVSVLPKVVGKPVDEAVQILHDAGYEPIKYETQFDEKAKEGLIIRQTPEGGDETKPGRKVYLIISGGKEMVVMPNLIGQQLKDARILLVRSNLGLGKTDFGFSDSIASGVVIQQSPRVGTKISAEQKIDIVVSEGSRAGKIEVPNLIDASVGEAVLKLGNAKLGVGSRNYVPNDSRRLNQIVEQSPKPGEFVQVGSTVDLWITTDKQLESKEQH